MQYTPDQEAAAAAFTAFMVSDEKEMVISGPAGTGKSTLLKRLMASQDHVRLGHVLGNLDSVEDWKLTATTNKAAEVLQGSTGTEAATVHSTLGIQVRDDYKTGKQLLSRKPNSPILMNTLLVVDECSMIDSDLDRLIDQSTMKCKILYVGDHCQLPPVMEDLSPVFKRNEPVRLTTVVRSQHTPAITALCNQLRQTVEDGVFWPIQEVPGIIRYLTQEEAQAEIHEDFVVQQRQDARILAFANQTVIGLNNWIREQKHLPPHYTVGETVVANSAAQCQFSDSRLRIEQELKIIGVGDPYKWKPAYDSEAWVREITTTGGIVLVAEDPAHMQALSKHYGANKNWEAYFKIKNNIADIRPRDACTVHKSQGSTYRKTYVNLTDIGRCNIAALVARLLYVACSRSTHEICFLGNLPEKYRGA